MVRDWHFGVNFWDPVSCVPNSATSGEVDVFRRVRDVYNLSPMALTADLTGGMNRPIWIISARVGAGHVQAARAVEEALSARGMADRVYHLDLMTLVPSWFRKLYAGGYAWMATRHPRLFGRAFHMTDRDGSPWPSVSERLRIRIDGWIIRELRRWLRDAKPRLIVHTHFLAPAPVGRWIESEGWPTRQVAVVTDFYPHRIWLARPVERYFVAADMTREQLVVRGVDAERISVTGIPVIARHRQPTDKDRVFREFDWPVGRPVLLLMAGSDFVVGPIEKVVDELLSAFPDVTLQVAGGKNETLLRALEAKKAGHPNLRVIGFTDRIQDLFTTATLVISKTGGITTSECLARGAAVVALFPVPGQEEANADYLVSHGAGVKVMRVADVTPAVRGLLESPERVSRMRERAGALGRGDAADRVVDAVLPLAE